MKDVEHPHLRALRLLLGFGIVGLVFSLAGCATVTTGAATSVGETTATLNGTVNPNGVATTYHFGYGTTIAYGSRVPSEDVSAGSGTSPVHVSTDLAGLSRATTYHFRLVASSSDGETVRGADQTFSTAGTAANPTVVSLTFDDTRQSQYQAREPLRQHGMHATFFVNSDLIGASPSYLTLSQLQELAADGNEIGGHTLDHVYLPRLSQTEQTRQICDDRTQLIDRGFSPVVSFSYPFGAYNAGLEEIVRSCGYTSARLGAWAG